MASGECGRTLGGAKILQKIMVHPLSVTKINMYCGVGGGGGWHEGGAKTLQKIMASPLFVIKINKYCGQNYNAYKQYNCILPATN